MHEQIDYKLSLLFLLSSLKISKMDLSVEWKLKQFWFDKLSSGFKEIAFSAVYSTQSYSLQALRYSLRLDFELKFTASVATYATIR